MKPYVISRLRRVLDRTEPLQELARTRTTVRVWLHHVQY